MNRANRTKSMKNGTVVPWANTNDLSQSPSKNFPGIMELILKEIAATIEIDYFRFKKLLSWY